MEGLNVFVCVPLTFFILLPLIHASSPSGVNVPVGDVVSDGILWKQVFYDDFTIDLTLGAWPGPYNLTWGSYGPDWNDTSHNGRYNSPKVISMSGGVMYFYIHTDQSTGTHYVCTPYPIVQYNKGQLYGRYSARMRSDPISQYKVAWLLWPLSNVWPADGEIDFPEGNLDGNFAAYMHYANASGGQSAFTTKSNFSTWHTFTMEWAPGKVTFYVDDAVLGVATKQVPHLPMHWVLQTETALSGGPPENSISGHVYTDWVAVYTYNGTAPSTSVGTTNQGTTSSKTTSQSSTSSETTSQSTISSQSTTGSSPSSGISLYGGATTIVLFACLMLSF